MIENWINAAFYYVLSSENLMRNICEQKGKIKVALESSIIM